MSSSAFTPARYRFFLILLLLLADAACRKDQLSWPSAVRLESHTTHQLNRVFFASDSLCFAVGGVRYTHATVLRSADGGFSWQVIDIPEAGKILNDICQNPDKKLFACGIDGRLVRSNDGGATWHFQQIPDWKSYKTLAFPGADSGILMGGISFYSGTLAFFDASGQASGSDSLPYEINRLRFVNTHTGFAAGYGALLKTTDGGASWQELPGASSDNFTGLYALSEKEIWLCGYNGSIYRTIDGGASWQYLRNGNNPRLKKYRLYDLVLLNSAQAYCVGEKGMVLYTDDGGRHWMEMKPFTSANLRSIALCPNGDLLICGEDGELWRVKP